MDVCAQSLVVVWWRSLLFLTSCHVDVGTWFIVSRLIWITTCQLSWMTLRNIIHRDPKLVIYTRKTQKLLNICTSCFQLPEDSQTWQNILLSLHSDILYVHSPLNACWFFLFQRMFCTPWRGQCPYCGAVGSMLLWPSSSSRNSSISSTCGSSTSWWQTKSQACAATIGGQSFGSSSVTLRLGQRNKAWNWLPTATSAGLCK